LWAVAHSKFENSGPKGREAGSDRGTKLTTYWAVLISGIEMDAVVPLDSLKRAGFPRKETRPVRI
jgi:hypothetical protein